MPRKQAATPREPTEAANPDDAQRVCYLDEFLESVTETADLPAEVKRNLARLRDLDTQAQEQYERMQKQSKNHIARAKRSVQGGQEPDDELLRKARRTCQELLDIDSEKVEVADKMYDDLTRHLERCESELCKFEEELRERGQLKAPASVKAPEPAAAAADGAAGLSVQLGGGGDMPAPPGTGGRRGRQPSTAGLPEASPTSHKRGRGRKVSHKEAERQRQPVEMAVFVVARRLAPRSRDGTHWLRAALRTPEQPPSDRASFQRLPAPPRGRDARAFESPRLRRPRQRQAAELAAAASAAGGGGAGFGAASPGGGELGGAFGGTPARQEFTDAALPIASREVRSPGGRSRPAPRRRRRRGPEEPCARRAPRPGQCRGSAGAARAPWEPAPPRMLLGLRWAHRTRRLPPRTPTGRCAARCKRRRRTLCPSGTGWRRKCPSRTGSSRPFSSSTR